MPLFYFPAYRISPRMDGASDASGNCTDQSSVSVGMRSGVNRVLETS
jgi:hypothetical protein